MDMWCVKGAFLVLTCHNGSVDRYNINAARRLWRVKGAFLVLTCHNGSVGRYNINAARRLWRVFYIFNDRFPRLFTAFYSCDTSVMECKDQ